MNYIIERKNALDAELCENLIKHFEMNSNNHFKGYLGTSSRVDIEYKNCDELYISDNYSEKLSLLTQSIFTDYIKGMYLAGGFSMEEFRIKRYLEDGKHMYKWHVDTDSSKCRRLVAVIYYLNDVAHGGETVIKVGTEEIKIVPERGKVLLFPANFCYPHCGLPPTSNSKYILTTSVGYA